jgi:hypothetical protein
MNRKISNRRSKRAVRGVPGRSPGFLRWSEDGNRPPVEGQGDRREPTFAVERKKPGVAERSGASPWHPQAGRGKQLTETANTNSARPPLAGGWYRRRYTFWYTPGHPGAAFGLEVTGTVKLPPPLFVFCWMLVVCCLQSDGRNRRQRSLQECDVDGVLVAFREECLLVVSLQFL